MFFIRGNLFNLHFVISAFKIISDILATSINCDFYFISVRKKRFGYFTCLANIYLVMMPASLFRECNQPKQNAFQNHLGLICRNCHKRMRNATKCQTLKFGTTIALYNYVFDAILKFWIECGLLGMSAESKN